MVQFDIVAVRATCIRCDCFAIFQADDPAVQRAGDTVTMYDALCQWPVFVRAAVVQRKHLVVYGAKHRDFAVGCGHSSSALARDVFQFSYLYPVQCVHLLLNEYPG